MPVTKAYKAWSALKQRCLNPNNTEYNRYGGRGISVCDAWRKSFKTFLLDMGEPPTPGHSIDRIDNDGNYEPGNCRWATRKEQSLNRTYSCCSESVEDGVKVPCHLHKCLRCDYEWMSMMKEPITCAGCRSSYWNRPPRKKKS